MAIPRTPFPSFTLVLSRQAADDDESVTGMQNGHVSNIEPPIDLMVSRRTGTIYVFSSPLTAEPSRRRKHLILVYQVIPPGKWLG